MKKNKCEQCGVDFERQYMRRFCCKACWHLFNAKKLSSFNNTRFQWKNCTEDEKLEQVKLRFEKKVIKRDGCWGWKGYLNKNRYTSFRFGSDGKGFKERYGHRISWIIKNGDIPNDKQVCHKCDNPECTNPDHLFLGTIKENHQDKVRKGRGNHGSRHGNSKLTEEQVKEIKILYNNGQKVSIIMQKFDASRMNIHRIGKSLAWKHVNI